MSIATQPIDLSIIEKMERYIENLKAFEELFKNQKKFIEGGGDLYQNLNQLISNYNQFLEFENSFLNSPILLKLKTIGKYTENAISVIKPFLEPRLLVIYFVAFLSYRISKMLEIPKLFDNAEKNSEKTIKKIIKNIKNRKSLFESNQKLFAFNNNGHDFPGIFLEKINVNHRSGDRKAINTLNEPANRKFKFNIENQSQLLETLGFSLLVQGDSGTGKTHLVETQIPKYYDSSVLLSVNTKSLMNGVSSKPGIVHRVLDQFSASKELLKPSKRQIAENFLKNINMFETFLEKLNSKFLELEEKQKKSEKTGIIVNFDEFEKFLDDESVVESLSSDDLMKLFKFFDKFSNFQSDSQYCDGKKSRIIISMTSNKKLEETELFKKFEEKEKEANPESPATQKSMQNYLNTRLQGNIFKFENQSFIEILKFIREKCFKVNENSDNTTYDFDQEISLFLEKSILGALAVIKQQQNSSTMKTSQEEKELEKNKVLFKIIYGFLFDHVDINNNFNYKDEELEKNIKSKIQEKFSDKNKAENIKKLLKIKDDQGLFKIKDDQGLFCMRDFNITIDEMKDKLYPKTKVELTFLQKFVQFLGF